MTTTPPAAAPVKVEQVEDAIFAFAQSYEFRSEDGDHTPEPHERAMLEDAIHEWESHRLAAIASPGVPRDRLAEVLYELDGFYPPMPERDTPVWVAESAVAPHSGDCTKDPWPCLRCHAEEYRDRADNVLVKLAVAHTPEPIQGYRPSHPAADEEARARITEVLTGELADAYDCTRVWSAWSVGTMSEEDFVPINDRVDDIVDAIAAALRTPVDAVRADEVEGLRRAAAVAQAQFAFYAHEHRKAGKDDKAATNQHHADLLAAALASEDRP